MSEEELGDWRENGTEDGDAAKMQLPSHEVGGKLDEYTIQRSSG